MTTAETSDTVTLTNTVDTAKTWVIVTARETGAAYSQETGAESYRADLQDANTVRLRRGQTNSVGVNWSAQVIEDRSAYGLWNVQQGDIAMGTAATTGTYTLPRNVNTNNTIPLGTAYPHFSPSGSLTDTSIDNVDNAIITVDLTNENTVTATRGVTDSWAVDFIIQAVEFILESHGLTNAKLMRHGKWFSYSGVEQPFEF